MGSPHFYLIKYFRTRLDSNIKSKSSNNTYLNVIKLLFLIYFFQFEDHRIGKFSNNIDFRKLDYFDYLK